MSIGHCPELPSRTAPPPREVYRNLGMPQFGPVRSLSHRCFSNTPSPRVSGHGVCRRRVLEMVAVAVVAVGPDEQN